MSPATEPHAGAPAADSNPFAGSAADASTAAEPRAAAPAPSFDASVHSTDGAEPQPSVPAPESSPDAARLAELRGRIQQIDRELIGLIAQRVRLARDVGAAKRALGVPTLDPAREAAVVRNAGELAREAGIGDEDVRYIFWHLIGLSRRAQMEGE